MILAISFILLTLCSFAKPITRVDAVSKLLSVPLVQSHSLEGKYPSITHQQHINRGLQRLLFTQGQPPLSNTDLLNRISRRVSALLLQHETVHSSHLETQAEDVGYYGPMKMGTPSRTFQLLMDSGSADLWVGAEDCQCDDGGSCGKHNFLGPTSSSSFHSTQETWVLWYGTGTVSGYLAHDKVSISGLAIEQYKFGVAQNESRDFTGDVPFDGILGLAQSKASRQHTVSFLESLKIAGHIDHAIASYRIPRRRDGLNDGELTLGGMNPKKYDPSYMITVSNINDRGFWEVPIDDIQVNGQSLGLTGRSAVLDTGSTLCLVPSAETTAIHRSISDSRSDGNAWIIPCKTTASIAITIGGKTFPINPLDVAWIPVSDERDESECYSGVSEGGVSTDGHTAWLLGDVFLKNVYFSTNHDTNEVTLARLL
ncbi:aspartic peptidase A1 [Hymenopellis radicata]|nr:aspartic peptidase A1 [Hymenopellis radicata]